MLNYYHSISEPTVVRNITTDELFSTIKYGSNWSEIISQARSLDRFHDQKMYESMKHRVPAVTYNFLFNGYRSDENIIKSTGFIYYDLDFPKISGLTETQTATIIRNPYIYSSYKSFGGKGYVLVVQVKGLTKGNYNLAYETFAEELGISEIYDTNAKKMQQANVISYDPNIYINPSSTIFFASNLIVPINEKVSLSSISLKKREHLELDDTFFWSNKSLYCDKYSIKTFKQGVDIVEAYSKKTHVGKRKVSLFNICLRLAFLNPLVSYKDMFRQINSINLRICDDPLEVRDIHDVIKSVFRYKQENKLFVTPKKKKILFGNLCGLSKTEKQSFAAKTMGRWKTEDTLQKIESAINSWDCDERITIRGISSKTGKSISTVKRHWKHFKQVVSDINRKRNG